MRRDNAVSATPKSCRSRVALLLVALGTVLATLCVTEWPSDGVSPEEATSSPSNAAAALHDAYGSEPAPPVVVPARRTDAVRNESAGAAESETTAPLPAAPARSVGARTRVRVTVRLRGPAMTAQDVPTPELLRMGADGRTSPVAAPAPGKRAATAHGRDAAPGPTETTLAFDVESPGRYVPAWHHWVQVPGTNTWRAVRGSGTEFDVAAHECERDIVVEVSPSQLVSDPALDRVVPGATYRITPKDG